MSFNGASRDGMHPSSSAMGFEALFKGEHQAVWSGPDHWRKLCPSLTISEEEPSSVENAKHPAKDKSKNERRTTRLVEDGYVLVDEVAEEKLRLKIRDAIATLHAAGYPATFVLLYNETWELAQTALKTLAGATHSSNVFNFDILAWYIDPRENVAGFSPHRDRQPVDTKSSFHDDQQAKYVTMWMALSNATPENSCLYVIPKQYDPGYTEGDSDTKDIGDERRSDDPMWRALSTKESFQNIRALPRLAGQSVLFTHRILHWGSRGNPNSNAQEPPRIAISFVCSDPTFERPYLKSWQVPPSFSMRLLLVCSQLLIYYQRLDLSKECIRSCYEYCKQHADELDPTYRNKVTVEFVKAMKEATESGDMGGDKNDDDGGDEAVLEAMLDAEEGGYGDFEDDYDELDEENAGGGGSYESDENDSEEDGEGVMSLFGKRPRDANDGGDVVKKKTKENL